MERHGRKPASSARGAYAAMRAIVAALSLMVVVAVPAAVLLYLTSSQAAVPTLSAVALLAAWTLLMIGLGMEIAEANAARRGRSTGLPGVGGPLQTFARWLVGSLVAGWGILGLGGTASASSDPSPPALPPADTPAELHHDRSVGAGGPAPIARAVAPDAQASRAPAVRQSPAPTPVAAPAAAAPVQDPRQPDGATVVTVEPGDSFWDLAERELIEAWGREPTDSEVARYWQDYIEANRHRLLPPGNPDLIHPGQAFTAPTVPGDATAPPPPAPGPPPDGQPGDGETGGTDAMADADDTPPDEGEPAPTAPAEPGTPEGTAPDTSPVPPYAGESYGDELGADGVPPEAHGDITGAGDDEPERAPAEGASPGDAPDGSPPDSSSPGGTSPGGASSDDPAAAGRPDDIAAAGGEPDRETDDRAASPSGSPTPLLAAGGLILGGVLLGLHRRRSTRQRHRRAGERPRRPAPDLQATEEIVTHGGDEGAARRVDAALRAAAAGAGSRGLPPLRWVETSPEATMLVLQEPWPSSAPAGFRTLDSTTWLTTSPTQDLEELGLSLAAPAPTMVPIGATGERSEALIELEASGVVLLHGAQGRADDLLRALAVAVATSPWNERSRVVLVGLDGDLADLPRVIRAGFDAALDIAETHVAQVAEALEAGGWETTTQARTVGSRRDPWDPVVVVSATRPRGAEHIRRLQALAERPHHGVCVITRAPEDGGSSHGRGADGVSSAGRALVPQDDGSLHVEGIDEVVWPRLLDEPSTDGLVRLLGQADGHDAGASEADAGPLHPVPATGPGTLRPGVDQLLDDVEVLVRVLGEVEAVHRPGTPAERALVPSRPKGLELVTYLAARQQPVSADELGRKLFPVDDDPAAALAKAVDAAHALVGADMLRSRSDGSFEVPAAVATDYGLFAELTAHAEDTDDPHRAAWLLTEALDLVRGAPFAGLGSRYSWVRPHRDVIAAQVVDAAEELAEVRLALGDWRSAEWAARQGLLTTPNAERLHRLLMRVAVAAGRGASGVHEVFDDLAEAVRRIEQVPRPEEVLAAETLQLRDRLAT